MQTIWKGYSGREEWVRDGKHIICYALIPHPTSRREEMRRLRLRWDRKRGCAYLSAVTQRRTNGASPIHAPRMHLRVIIGKLCKLCTMRKKRAFCIPFASALGCKPFASKALLPRSHGNGPAGSPPKTSCLARTSLEVFFLRARRLDTTNEFTDFSGD